MTLSKVMACLLCLTVSAGTVGAQGVEPSNADRLKKRIELERRALLRHYEEYITSLQKDIEHFKEVGKTLDPKDTAAIKENEAKIERLTKEHEAALKEQAAAQPAPGVAGQAAAQPSPSPSPAQKDRPVNVAQLPCGCPTGMTPEEEKPKGEMSEEEKSAYEKLKGEKLKEVKKNLPAGVIWCGRASELSAQTFAKYAAPILWFSPNEPLLLEGNKLPEPLPGDPTKDSAVVYYRISEVLLKPGKKLARNDTDKLELENVKGLTLKYYFYYSKDSGLGKHPHDLESVRLDVHFARSDNAGNVQTDPAKATHHVAYITRVIGAAHGVTWYGNQLDIGKDQKWDTSLPITLLIEEGKHATIPDRNADGFYSPGYDVNRRYTDAWGVRDLLGSGALGSATYEGAMTKPRRPEHMVMVEHDEADRACLLKPYKGDHHGEVAKARRTYKLTPAQVFEVAQQQPQQQQPGEGQVQQAEESKEKSKADKKLFNWMKREKFPQMKDGEPVPFDPKPTQGDIFLLRAARWAFGIERNEEFFDAIPLAYRYEGRQHGFTFLPPVGRHPVPKIGGYVLPKMTFMFPNIRQGALPGRKIDRPYRFSLEALYTPSAARAFDWYVASGPEWSRPVPGSGYEARLVNEGGLRFRFNGGVIGVPSLLLGGRLGMRITGFAEARQPRLIIEFGTGAF